MLGIVIAVLCFGNVGAFTPALLRAKRNTGLKASAYEGFLVSGERKVDVFKNAADIQEGICCAFCVAAAISIATKGSFSVAIPSGSVVKALGALADSGRVDFSSVHVFFTNDQVGESQPAYEGALADFVGPCGVPLSQVYRVPNTGDAVSAARDYSRTIQSSRVVEDGQFDLVLLGTGTDGHCASLFPGSPQVEGGSSDVMLAKKSEGAVTVSLETLNKAKKVIVSASGAARGLMVLESFSKAEDSRMPAAMVQSPDTTWLVDDASVAEYREKFGTRESLAAEFTK
eukprot:CAMPEP_0171679940 /NCGR_PEP_ID=MMETSP0990-20121206/56552_1 /TAXON_ID=483369 /ORGANISM="non described non described, Strain CCMP2098" /LENGTH=285 /DNA_ID=CAMNT_0012266853 /DNA_START=78 /DNA_END=935 /DNA_ORIENTATION=-